MSPGDQRKTRRFRFSDSAHAKDRVDLEILNHTEQGKILRDLGWTNLPNRKAQNRYATIRLEWTKGGGEAKPALALDGVICWQFLGLGGGAGNAGPEAP